MQWSYAYNQRFRIHDMRLRRVIIEGFRGYQERQDIDVDDLTAIVGKNEAGKSTILEALEIFFNNKTIKIDPDDACKHEGADPKLVRIGCVFDDLPENIILDTACETSLTAEELLNTDSHLEIHRVYNCSLKSPKSAAYIVAQHRLREDGKSLLSLKNADLKKAVKAAGLEVEDQKKNPLLRAALRERLENEPEVVDLPMDEGNCAEILKGIERRLPVFALFQSDRASRDSDAEVQDPVKAAIELAVKTAADDLEKAEQLVRKQIESVLERTMGKLREMDPDLAKELQPRIDPPKWKSAFSVKLDSDDGVPLNKRGSGVRRLIVLNFFRAEAERRRDDADADSVIYAIEEPETSQHPDNQLLLMEAFAELAGSGSAQVLLTTHVPGLAGLVPVEGIRFIQNDPERGRTITRATEDADALLQEIADSLGVIPDSRVEVLFCVEGPHDVAFFSHATKTLSAVQDSVLSLESCAAIAFVPLGGSTLGQWVKAHYLRELKRPEFHVYDGDKAGDKRYTEAVKAVNARTDGSSARFFKRHSAEGFLHPDAINRVCGVRVACTEGECMVTKVSQAMVAANIKVPLADGKEGGPHKNHVKTYLNETVAQAMTAEEWVAADTDDELLGVLTDLCKMVNTSP